MVITQTDEISTLTDEWDEEMTDQEVEETYGKLTVKPDVTPKKRFVETNRGKVTRRRDHSINNHTEGDPEEGDPYRENGIYIKAKTPDDSIKIRDYDFNETPEDSEDGDLVILTTEQALNDKPGKREVTYSLTHDGENRIAQNGGPLSELTKKERDQEIKKRIFGRPRW